MNDFDNILSRCKPIKIVNAQDDAVFVFVVGDLTRSEHAILRELLSRVYDHRKILIWRSLDVSTMSRSEMIDLKEALEGMLQE